MNAKRMKNSENPINNFKMNNEIMCQLKSVKRATVKYNLSHDNYSNLYGISPENHLNVEQCTKIDVENNI